MAMRMMARRLVNPAGEALMARSTTRRGMSGIEKILEEKERAAEAVYIKKMEREKLAKLAAKGFSAEEAQKAVSGHPDADPEAVKVINETTSTASTDSDTNYAVIAGMVGVAALGYWFLTGGSKKDDK